MMQISVVMHITKMMKMMHIMKIMKNDANDALAQCLGHYLAAQRGVATLATLATVPLALLPPALAVGQCEEVTKNFLTKVFMSP